MRVKVKRAGHEVARGHDRWHIDCVNAMTRPAGTRESTPEPTSDSLGSAWRRAGQRQELRDGRVFGVRQSSVCSRGLYVALSTITPLALGRTRGRSDRGRKSDPGP